MVFCILSLCSTRIKATTRLTARSFASWRCSRRRGGCVWSVQMRPPLSSRNKECNKEYTATGVSGVNSTRKRGISSGKEESEISQTSHTGQDAPSTKEPKRRTGVTGSRRVQGVDSGHARRAQSGPDVRPTSARTSLCRSCASGRREADRGTPWLTDGSKLAIVPEWIADLFPFQLACNSGVHRSGNGRFGPLKLPFLCSIKPRRVVDLYSK